jgi:hypothetical protein
VKNRWLFFLGAAVLVYFLFLRKKTAGTGSASQASLLPDMLTYWGLNEPAITGVSSPSTTPYYLRAP